MFTNFTKWCYWTVADGKHGDMMAGCIKSAREVGVQTDFHVWSDKPVAGAIHHQTGNFDKRNYLFKLHFLKNEVSKLDYDWFVFIDADSFFTRNPGNLPEQLCKRDPIHVCLESKCLPESKRKDWWGIPTEKYIELMRKNGVKTYEIYNTNAGFWIVHKSVINQVYSLAMQFWEKCHKLGYTQTTEEPPLAYVGHMLIVYEAHHNMANGRNIWASDWKGVWKDKLPADETWKFTDYMNDLENDVKPAIVHAMRSKDALIKYGAGTVVEQPLINAKPVGDRDTNGDIDYSKPHDFFIGHQMLGDVIGFAAAAHLYANKIGKTVRIWFDPKVGNRKDVVNWFDGIEWVEKDKLVNSIDCGINPKTEDWPKFNGVKRFYQWMDPSMTPKKSFDIHMNKERIITDKKLIGLITHSNTQGDIDEPVLSRMLEDAKAQYPLHKIVLIGNTDNTILPKGVIDLRQSTGGDINWIINTIREMDLLITPQSGPCFIAAGFRIPMWVYRSKRLFWDYVLNYDNYKVQRWYNRPNMTPEQKIELIKDYATQKDLKDILELLK